MLNQFIDEVISEGAEAVLPHNLETKWLDMIYVAARNFLKIAATRNEDVTDEDVLSDTNSLMMLSSVIEIAQNQNNYAHVNSPAEIPEETLFEYISCYSLNIIFECISRETGIEFETPTIETIFDKERLYRVEQAVPELTDLLNRLIVGI
jgi:hypothetical protein